MFAAGMIGFELLAEGQGLFQGENKGKTKARRWDNDRSNLLDLKLDGVAKNLILTMTQSDPERRITAKEAENHPFFQDAKFHLSAINEVVDALIEQGSASPARAALNDSFFMVLREAWKGLPFVVPEVLTNSKYSNHLDACLRFCRNFFEHAGLVVIYTSAKQVLIR